MWNGANFLMDQVDQVDQMDKTDYPALFRPCGPLGPCGPLKTLFTHFTTGAILSFCFLYFASGFCHKPSMDHKKDVRLKDTLTCEIIYRLFHADGNSDSRAYLRGCQSRGCRGFRQLSVRRGRGQRRVRGFCPDKVHP